MEKKQFELFDQVALIKTSFIKDGWATVYQSNKAEVDTQIYCNIVHDEYLTEYLDHHNWMIEPGREGRPSIISRGGQQSSYHAFSENGIEPFLYYKFFTHNKEKYIDVSEEFINYFHLYETGSSKQNRTYFFTDENGDLEEAIKIEAELVQVKLRFLMEYISVRNVHFTVCFDFMCMSSEKLSSFGLEEKYVPFNDEHTHYTHLIRVLPFTGAGELQSWIHGKVIIKNMESRRHSYWFDAGSEDFASFIIGYDQAGDLDKVSSDSEEHKFFTLTYFSKTVLDKYYNNPDKYKVSGYCGREDARNYIFVLDLLDKFTKRAPASEIEPLINSFQDGVMTYSAWNPSDTALSWAGLRNTELMNWNLLAEKLGTLTVNLNELSWFEPGMVIEEYLLKIYSSSRSILNKKHGHGIDQLFQPGIRERMADQYTQVYLLEEWLKT